MAKNNKSDFRDMGSLVEAKKNLEKKIKQMSIPCSHLNKHGQLKVEMLKGSACKCKRCGAIFDIEQYSNDTIRESIKVVHDVINQIKVFTDSPNDDSSLIKTLGEIDYNLSTVEELYNRMTNDQGRGKKKKKNDRNYNDFGSVGRDVSFVSGNKKKSNSRW